MDVTMQQLRDQNEINSRMATLKQINDDICKTFEKLEEYTIFKKKI